jgi:hypothetical protein
MATIYGKSYGKPTLDLNFAGNKSLIDTITRANYITFTRAQSGNEATYVGSDGLIKYASADEPRFDHDPETLESLGLLIEESRTNLLRYTNDIGNAPNPYWIQNSIGVNVIPNATLSPDGQMNATFVQENLVNTSHYIRHPSSHIPSDKTNTIFTYSVYIKPNGRTNIIFYNDIGGTISRFNLDNPSSNVEILPDGWYKLIGQYTSDSINPQNTSFFIGMEDAEYTDFVYGSKVYQGDGTSGFYVWGAQCEEGSFPTSYIPTSGSTETRSADVASITGSNFSSWYNQSEGTLLTTADYNGNNPSNYNMIAEGYSGLSARDFSCGIGASNPNFTTRYSFTNLDLIPVGGPIPTKTAFKLVGSYSADGSAAVFNGGLVKTTGATTSVLTPADAMSIGYRVNSSSLFLNGHISRLTYYPKRLPDIELQQLTK